MKVDRTGNIIRPNPSRVLLRPFNPASEEQKLRIIKRILGLPEPEVKIELENIINQFGNRHKNLTDRLLGRFETLKQYLPDNSSIGNNRKILIGSYFMHEYSVEHSALFNPSMIWHYDQTGLPEGSKRFIISLRATGEGHISSIAFRTGTIDQNKKIIIEAASSFITSAKKIVFNFPGLYNYEIFYEPETPISERIIFPQLPAESNGIEDARFVRFFDDDGVSTYYATYTAYDGKKITPGMLETKDFLHFKIFGLSGSEVINKGMALFPRKIKGKYAMISRQDNENIFIMFSENLLEWNTKEPLLKPKYPWEFVQLGNCGSPIETDAGWLVLSHAVGAMRKYCIGAFLLDKNDPTKVIGRSREPFLSPNPDEREGYVPNVVYSCGGQVFSEKLIIPYAMSDYASSFAIVDLRELINNLF